MEKILPTFLAAFRPAAKLASAQVRGIHYDCDEGGADNEADDDATILVQDKQTPSRKVSNSG